MAILLHYTMEEMSNILLVSDLSPPLFSLFFSLLSPDQDSLMLVSGGGIVRAVVFSRSAAMAWV